MIWDDRHAERHESGSCGWDAWPEPFGMEDLCGAAQDMVEQYYHLNPHKVPEDGVDYTGPAVHPKLYEPVDFPPQSKLRGPALDRSFDDQGREPISVILECVLKMGMEQGMRIRATENEARARGHLDKAIEHLENEDMPRGFVAAAIESARGRLSNGQQAEQQ